MTIKGLGLLVKGVAPALLLSGCVMGRVYRDHPLDEIKIATIQRGVTTKQEILLTCSAALTDE